MREVGLACKSHSNEHRAVPKWVLRWPFDSPIIIPFEFHAVYIFHMLPEARESFRHAVFLFNDDLVIVIHVREVCPQESKRHCQAMIIIGLNDHAIYIGWQAALLFESLAMDFESVFDFFAENTAFYQVFPRGSDTVAFFDSLVLDALTTLINSRNPR